MEHQTGPDGPDRSDLPEWAAAVHPGEPETVPQASDDGPAAAVPSTGEPRVDAALRLLDRLPGLPVSEHTELFEQVHAELSDVLGELDSGPAAPAGG
jgi:hypothetical protein